eukprot:750700-Hanusia_phi.AAC.4
MANANKSMLLLRFLFLWTAPSGSGSHTGPQTLQLLLKWSLACCPPVLSSSPQRANRVMADAGESIRWETTSTKRGGRQAERQGRDREGTGKGQGLALRRLGADDKDYKFVQLYRRDEIMIPGAPPVRGTR